MGHPNRAHGIAEPKPEKCRENCTMIRVIDHINIATEKLAETRDFLSTCSDSRTGRGRMSASLAIGSMPAAGRSCIYSWPTGRWCRRARAHSTTPPSKLAISMLLPPGWISAESSTGCSSYPVRRSARYSSKIQQRPGGAELPSSGRGAGERLAVRFRRENPSARAGRSLKVSKPLELKLHFWEVQASLFYVSLSMSSNRC